MKKHSLFIVIVIIFCIPVLLPLFNPGFFQTDDGEWMIIRFSAFHQALADGQFPVRMLMRLNNEYGYPVANFLYPGFMYLAELPKILGFGFVDTIKISFGIALIESAVFTFLWLSKIFNRFPSVIGAFIYLYAPYHLFDVYRRGSMGEVLALATVPFILWQLERQSLFWSTLGVSLLILSHNTLSLLFFPVIFLYMLLSLYVSKSKLSLLVQYILTFLFGIGIAAFFWLPALFDLQYTVFYKTPVANWGEYFAQFPLIGFSLPLILFVTFIFFVLRKMKIIDHRLTLLFFIIGIISLFLSTFPSAFLWNILPASLVQFPFRFLSITILCAAFLTASVLSRLPKQWAFISSMVLIFLTLFSALEFMNPVSYFDKGEGFYTTNMATTTVKDEYMPVWVKNVPSEQTPEVIEIIQGKGTIEAKRISNKTISFTLDMEGKGIVRVSRVYFPGYDASVDEKQVAISYNNENGVMDIPIPLSYTKQKVSLTFKETPIRLLADGISGVSLIMLILLTLIQLRRKIT